MALIKENNDEIKSGISKKFSAESNDMIMDLVQRFQYQYPVKSTIRELTSNAVDAISEREVAKKILTGAAKVSDYYEESKSALTSGSTFDINYYDLNWLSDDTRVRIVYEDRGTEKDVIRIIDNGVGLGGKRLEKYFEIGYSSKRLSKWALGKFGIGGKAAFSTGEPYYTIKSRYNGQEFQFNVYEHNIESTVPAIDLGTGKENNYYEFQGGDPSLPKYKAYYRATTEKNGTEISVNTKKFKKQEYLDAVKSQLLYFNNVDLFLKEGDKFTEIPIKAEILFENDQLIISNNNQYSKPHIVLDNVNYGYIHFEELSIEDKLGNVGIKVNPEEVTVNPSRESLVWDDVTRATVLDRFKQASKIAAELITDSLDERDILKWLKSYLSLGNKASTGVLSQLAGIVDLNSIEPVYKYEKGFKINDARLLLPGIKLEKIYTDQRRKKDGTFAKVLKRDTIRDIKDVNPNSTFVVTKQDTDLRTLKYTLSTVGPFYLFTYIDEVEDAEITKLTKTSLNDIELGDLSTANTTTIKSVLNARSKVLKDLINASVIPMWYDTIKVPDDWGNDTDAEEDEIEDVKTTGPKISLEEQRKLQERVVAFTPRAMLGSSIKIEWQKIEPKWIDVLSWDPETTYYGTEEDDSMLKLGAFLVRPSDAILPTFTDEERRSEDLRTTLGLHNSTQFHYAYVQAYGPGKQRTIVKVNQQLATKMKDRFKHISTMFFKEEDDTFTLDPLLVKWNTARYITDNYFNFRVLENFKRINMEKFKAFTLLNDYADKYNRDMDIRELKAHGLDEFLGFIDKMTYLQRYGDPDISRETMNLVGKPFSKINVIDLEMCTLVDELLEYSAPIKTLLDPILATDPNFSEELEKEIKFYISTKGL